MELIILYFILIYVLIILYYIFSGGNKSCPVHEWVGKFQGETVLFKMSSVCGHVMSLDFVGKYNSWVGKSVSCGFPTSLKLAIYFLFQDRVDPVELFTCPTEKKESNPKMKMPMFLAQAASGCDYLVLWLDCDKEGENICFEVKHSKALLPFSLYTNRDIPFAYPSGDGRRLAVHSQRVHQQCDVQGEVLCHHREGHQARYAKSGATERERGEECGRPSGVGSEDRLCVHALSDQVLPGKVR